MAKPKCPYCNQNLGIIWFGDGEPAGKCINPQCLYFDAIFSLILRKDKLEIKTSYWVEPCSR